MPRIFWGLLAAMLAACLSMNLWSAPKIEALAGGLRLFDMRLTGYSFAEAQAFVAAIGDRGVALYLGPQLWLDMLFPALLGGVLFLLYRWLFPGLPVWIVAAVALAAVAVDYGENARIAAMLRAGPEAMTPAMVAAASRLTVTKWGFALFGLAMVIVGAVLRLWRRRAATA